MKRYFLPFLFITLLVSSLNSPKLLAQAQYSPQEVEKIARMTHPVRDFKPLIDDINGETFKEIKTYRDVPQFVNKLISVLGSPDSDLEKSKIWKKRKIASFDSVTLLTIFPEIDKIEFAFIDRDGDFIRDSIQNALLDKWFLETLLKSPVIREPLNHKATNSQEFTMKDWYFRNVEKLANLSYQNLEDLNKMKDELGVLTEKKLFMILDQQGRVQHWRFEDSGIIPTEKQVQVLNSFINKISIKRYKNETESNLASFVPSKVIEYKLGECQDLERIREQVAQNRLLHKEASSWIKIWTSYEKDHINIPCYDCPLTDSLYVIDKRSNNVHLLLDMKSGLYLLRYTVGGSFEINPVYRNGVDYATWVGLYFMDMNNDGFQEIVMLPDCGNFCNDISIFCFNSQSNQFESVLQTINTHFPGKMNDKYFSLFYNHHVSSPYVETLYEWIDGVPVAIEEIWGWNYFMWGPPYISMHTHTIFNKDGTETRRTAYSTTLDAQVFNFWKYFPEYYKK